MTEEKTCGNCKHNKYEATVEDFFCGCQSGEWYGCPTFYEDACEEWEAKE